MRDSGGIEKGRLVGRSRSPSLEEKEKKMHLCQGVKDDKKKDMKMKRKSIATGGEGKVFGAERLSLEKQLDSSLTLMRDSTRSAS